MDTHMTTSPVFDDSPTLRARLPGEPDDGVSTGGDVPPLHAGKRETPLPPARKRRSGLLSGVAIIALAVIASGAFLVSPYNTVVPVPPALKLAALHAETRVAALLSHPTARPARAPSADQAKTSTPPSLSGTSGPASPILAASTPNVVAPAAELAPIQTPPPPAPVVQPPYKPAPPHTQMAELLDLQEGAAAPVPQETSPKSTSATPMVQPAQSGPQVPAPSSSHQPVTAQTEMPPPGYVAREPGAAPNPTSQKPQTPAKTADNGHTGSKPAQSGGEAPNLTAAAHLPVTRPAAASTSHVQPLQEVAVGQGNALAISHQLEAAPLAAPQQIQVLELVTQLATLIRDQRTEIANLQVDLRTSQKATAAKLGDFERRLALVEAGSALAAASNTAAPGTATTGATSPAPTATTVALTSAKAALAAASAPQTALPSAPVPTTTQANAAAPEQYRVQAASPGLAMLAAVDRSGGDGAQQAVQPGDILPGYGRVLSVAQQGTAWVVRTEHGTIQ